MDVKQVEHLKGLSVINITKYLMKKYSLNHEDAYKKLLASETYKILLNTESNMYLESDEYLTDAINIEFTKDKEELYNYLCVE